MVGAYKGVKGKVPALRSTFSKAKISELFGLSRAKKATVAKFNQVPYNSRAMETLIRDKYGDKAVTSSTLPKVNAKNVKLAGTRHPKTGMVFNSKGMPILDDVAKVDLLLPERVACVKNRKLHFSEATKELHKLIENGSVSRKQFSSKQLKAIFDDAETIPGCTWHHHENRGRMQLVSEKIHQKTGHLGGDALWGMEKK